MSHETYYYHNEQYARVLQAQKLDYFQKYLDFLVRYSETNDVILDVGCGPGLVADLARQQRAQRRFLGVEISQPCVAECQRKNLHCEPYDGQHLPFADESCDVVGSYNVLEHVEQPLAFLHEQVRVLKAGGHLLVVCPNFLSVTNNYHHHTRGVLQKGKNVASWLQRLPQKKVAFAKMATVERSDFQSDDDACNVTNPLDILRWATHNKLRCTYWSSQPIYKTGLSNHLDTSYLRYFLGSCFLVFRKET